MRLTPHQFRRVVVVAIVALSAIVVTGAAVRLTGSGLGCSDWPTCEENRLYAPAEYHALVEFINRLFTGVVSLAVVAAVVGAHRRTPPRRDLTLLSWGLVAGVAANGVLGGLTVLFELAPLFVIGHFLLSMLLLWNAVVLYHRAGDPDQSTDQVSEPHDANLNHAAIDNATLDVIAAAERHRQTNTLPRRLTTAGVILAGLVLVGGTVVTGTGPNGGDEEVERLPFSLREVARLHSIAAWLLVAVVVGLALVLVQPPTTVSGAGDGGQRRSHLGPGSSLVATKRLVGLVVIQGAVGYVQYFTGVPEPLVAVHVVGSILVWMATLDLWLRLRRPPAPGAPVVVTATAQMHRGSPSAGSLRAAGESAV